MTALILATVLSFASVHSSIFGKQVLKWLNKPTLKEKKLIVEKNDLKLEQSKLNMTDDFAKFSRIQRKINAIDQNLSDQRSEKNNIVLHFGLMYGVRFAMGLLLLVLSIYYRYTPVLELSSSIDLVPFDHIISYPNGHNQISFHFWVLCCTSVSRLIKI